MQAHTYCSYCGAKFPTKPWPRTCDVCNQTTWKNPLPVVVAVVMIGRGVLLVRRNIQPGFGKLALPGGFLDAGETWQEGISRELLEETGFDMHPDLFKLHHVASATDKKHVLIFGRSPFLPNIGPGLLKDFKPNHEVSELVITETPIELAFKTHTEVLAKFLYDAVVGFRS
jgi:8-oxo-dGTP diphosphatase